MLNRAYIKDLISFNEVELELDKGLIVLSGPSGAGKSILMNAMLSSFGYVSAEASVCEVAINKPTKLESDAYELEEEMTLKVLKKEKVRYYLDGQNISKKMLNDLFRPFVKYLSVRDKSGFESQELIKLIDNSIDEKSFQKLRKEYVKRYIMYKQKFDELQKIKEDEAKLAELIEFAHFEINKIESIDPKIGEDEELMTIKQQLSRIDKIKDALAHATQIFEYEESVSEVYRLLDKEESSFVEMMN